MPMRTSEIGYRIMSRGVPYASIRSSPVFASAKPDMVNRRIQHR